LSGESFGSNSFKVRILGIESSCDETSAAVIDADGTLRGHVINSQHEHAAFGGVVPELASRAHMRTAVSTIRKTLAESNLDLHQIDGIAVTAGPGLVGSLLVGISIAKGIALAAKKKLVGVHHLEGHIFSTLLEHRNFEPPFLTLLVSGGHSEIILVESLGNYQVLGRTRDDAAGEAFDKAAKMLGLLPTSGSFHGGRIIAEVAANGNSVAIPFPRGLSKEDTFDFSFSGLKTALRTHIGSLSERERAALLPDIAASYEMAIVDALITKTVKAMEKTDIKRVALVGGVAANWTLRRKLNDEVATRCGTLCCPSPIYCTDNAAMIAAVGRFRLMNGNQSGYDLDADPRMKL
jgi:N6-L-threonylcarbamoyladenine synthase